MTTITLENNAKLNKTSFTNVYELYQYIGDTYIFPDLQFKSVDELNFEELNELKKARNDNSKLLNI
ncbi:hypothetical protein EOM39_07805 [Candidatus Gracilibacteria bacterium]|nr:hypothetical protein [Candidatus Gracilibacteria bacterium]